MIKLKLFLILFYPSFALSQLNKNNFKFQLNHIDICVDSITFQSLLANKFITDTFSYIKIFKDSTGSEIIILGKEHLLHILPDKGFFENRLGALLLVHHSFTFNQTPVLLNYLQSFTSDSLYNRPYNSPELSIDYINVKENLKDTLHLLKFIPILQNFSKENYQSWGYSPADLENGISQEKYMKDYVGKETKEKLFKRIHSIQVNISADEQKRIPKLLLAYGYRRKGNKYTMEMNPSITTIPLMGKRKLSVRIKLSKGLRKKIIRMANASLIINGEDAWFTYKL